MPRFPCCVGGRHRTGVMTAAYRMTGEGWTADQAFKEMKQYNFGADFLHPEFKAFVYGYRPQPVRADVSSVRSREEREPLRRATRLGRKPRPPSTSASFERQP